MVSDAALEDIAEGDNWLAMFGEGHADPATFTGVVNDQARFADGKRSGIGPGECKRSPGIFFTFGFCRWPVALVEPCEKDPAVAVKRQSFKALALLICGNGDGF